MHLPRHIVWPLFIGGDELHKESNDKVECPGAI
jgi:hypothetical protein